MELRNKKILLMGLGILGGGVATAKWLLEQGSDLTITDLKDENYLEPSLIKLQKFESKIKYILGKHEEKDFLENDIIVINPDVPAKSYFVDVARKAGKQIENELTLFYKFAKFKTAVGVTGTRGKTTTTNWIGHILKNAGEKVIVLGNDPEKAFLSEIENCTEETIAVIETPSFQLEIFGESGLAPHVAVITNLYQDHLSRHGTMEAYAIAKSNIFKNQKENDFLIMDWKNEWTKFFLKQKPRAKVYFYSDMYVPGFDLEKFASKYGLHNMQNALAAASACFHLGVRDQDIVRALDNPPQVRWRQELVYDRNGLKIYNDTASTSPEASMEAMRRFKDCGEKFVLIAGGTDRELDFAEWGKYASNNLKEENIILLSGSATDKMKKEIPFSPGEFDLLAECVKEAVSRLEKGGGVIVFSPGAKSFEKFKNEFDRGEQFNAIVKEIL